MGDFAGAGKAVGMEIWRIEKLKPVALPKEEYGRFHSGDSYILLKTSQKKGHSSFSWDLHFWLGNETSQDEAGVAAYKTVELDDSLGGAPVQHREVQDHESDLFLSYFKSGIQYLDGGVESGFKKVERGVYETRLFHCKGKRNVRVRQVEVSHKSLNSGDVFILDCGLTLWQWNGKEASKFEKAKGVEVSMKIKNDERGGKAVINPIDEGSEPDDFWSSLGGKGAIASAADGGPDAAAEKGNSTLFRVSDASGSLQVDEVGKAPLKKGSLDTKDTFIIDDETQLFVWIGKGATKDERASGMKVATDFLAKNNRPAHTPITRVVEGGETPMFKQQFSDWTDQILPTDFSRPHGQSSVAKVEQKEIDVSGLHISKGSDEVMFDDGSGSLKIWRIENFEKAEWPQDLHGHFYAGDSFIILYTYINNRKEEYVIYFWQGRDSSTDEKGASALLAKAIDDELGGRPVQVRVVQGKEPQHFLTLFKGNMVVHSGGCASGFANLKDSDTYDTDGVSLFHVRGVNAVSTRAVQVEEKAASLNSGDCFILLTPDTQYVWLGKGSNADEQTTAKSIANKMKGNRTVKEVAEGSEDDAFWTPLGGKGEYASSKALVDAPREPRLFQCSNAIGRFDVEEIHNFSQDDLIDDDVMMLDTYTEVFVWIGSASNEAERREAMALARKYVESATDGRSKDCAIIGVPAGNEPGLFTCHFLGWDSTKATTFVDPYEAKLKALAAEKAPAAEDNVPAPSPAATAAHTYKDAAGSNLTYEEAKTAADIDPTCREQYLSADAFQATFGMSKDDFNKLAKWKQQDAKKKVSLF
eukprot:GFYU01004318.1.p1 GENE.GFYU01004318.1~~GFYU01004318.1.p1  ORF type:complete len:812 (-),score=336.28 GFYU01004318.1:98-2533(-)